MLLSWTLIVQYVAAHFLQICFVSILPSMLSTSALTVWVSYENMEEHPSWTACSAVVIFDLQSALRSFVKHSLHIN